MAENYTAAFYGQQAIKRLQWIAAADYTLALNRELFPHWQRGAVRYAMAAAHEASGAPAADKPVVCPKCGGTVFVVGQLAFERQDFNSATGDWSASYDRSYEEDYPQEAKCKECGEDVTGLLNEGTVQFYGVPPEREAPDPGVRS